MNFLLNGERFLTYSNINKEVDIYNKNIDFLINKNATRSRETSETKDINDFKIMNHEINYINEQLNNTALTVIDNDALLNQSKLNHIYIKEYYNEHQYINKKVDEFFIDKAYYKEDNIISYYKAELNDLTKSLAKIAICNRMEINEDDKELLQSVDSGNEENKETKSNNNKKQSFSKQISSLLKKIINLNRLVLIGLILSILIVVIVIVIVIVRLIHSYKDYNNNDLIKEANNSDNINYFNELRELVDLEEEVEQPGESLNEIQEFYYNNRISNNSLLNYDTLRKINISDTYVQNTFSNNASNLSINNHINHYYNNYYTINNGYNNNQYNYVPINRLIPISSETYINNRSNINSINNMNNMNNYDNISETSNDELLFKSKKRGIYNSNTSKKNSKHNLKKKNSNNTIELNEDNNNKDNNVDEDHEECQISFNNEQNKARILSNYRYKRANDYKGIYQVYPFDFKYEEITDLSDVTILDDSLNSCSNHGHKLLSDMHKTSDSENSNSS